MASPQAGWYEANRRAACDAAGVPQPLFPLALERCPAAALPASTVQIESALTPARDDLAFRTSGALGDFVLRESLRRPPTGRGGRQGPALSPPPHVHRPWQAPAASDARPPKKDGPRSWLDRSYRRQSGGEATGVPDRRHR